jgi:hypothetical protein
VDCEVTNPKRIDFVIVTFRAVISHPVYKNAFLPDELAVKNYAELRKSLAGRKFAIKLLLLI